jgi:hypothetical protein
MLQRYERRGQPTQGGAYTALLERSESEDELARYPLAKRRPIK